MDKKIKLDRVFLTILPIIVSIIITMLFHFYSSKEKLDISWFKTQDVLGTIIGMWGTLLGFIISAVSILIAFNGSKYTEIIRKSGHYQTIIFLYIVTCVFLIISIAVFLPLYIGNVSDLFTLCLLIFSLVVTFIYFFLDVFLLFLILNTINKK